MNKLFRPSAPSSAGVGRVVVDVSSTHSTNASTKIASHRRVTSRTASVKRIENAVYGHIRAVRTLGRTEMLPSEIAVALGIPTADVLKALTSLQSKGVKFNK